MVYTTQKSDKENATQHWFADCNYAENSRGKFTIRRKHVHDKERKCDNFDSFQFQEGHQLIYICLNFPA